MKKRIRFDEIQVRRTFQGAYVLSVMLNDLLLQQQYMGYSRLEARKKVHYEVNRGIIKFRFMMISGERGKK